MAFHGHTKIELHNVKTGENKVIEKHNIFTNYLHDVMQITPTPNALNWMSCGKGSQRYGATQWNNQANKNGGYPSIVDVLCGGILCLANEREENPDNYFLTTDDVITARGANIANASEDTQLGSYNVDLERTSDTSKTMVWDFAQNQGNGTISTIGLTNIGMALCGLGGHPSNITHTEASPFGDLSFAKGCVASVEGMYDDDFPSDQGYIYPSYISFEKGMLIGFLGYDSSKKILDLRYIDLNCNAINPLFIGGVYANSSSNTRRAFGRDAGTRYSPVKRVQFDLSAYSFAGNSYMNLSVTDDGILYVALHNATTLSENATITFVKIDLIGQRIIGTCPITNTSGEKLNLSGISNYKKTSQITGYMFTSNLPIFDGYMVFRTSGNVIKTFAINVENSTDIKEILTENGESVSANTYVMNFAGGLLLTKNGSESQNKYPAYKIDLKNGKAYLVRTGNMYNEYFPIDSSTPANCSYIIHLPSDNKLLNIWSFGSSNYNKGNHQDIFMSYKQDTLSTINLLDEPVIKTADMTMRITYTISLEEDEE